MASANDIGFMNRSDLCQWLEITISAAGDVLVDGRKIARKSDQAHFAAVYRLAAENLLLIFRGDCKWQQNFSRLFTDLISDIQRQSILAARKSRKLKTHGR